MLLDSPGSTVRLRVGRSLGGTKAVLGKADSKKAGPRVTIGDSSSGCGIGGAAGLRASDLRLSSSSRAAASFLSCLSSLILRSELTASSASPKPADSLEGLLSLISRWEADPGEALRKPRLLLRVFFLRNLSFASIALI